MNYELKHGRESLESPTDPVAMAILLKQYRKALENFGVTFADNGLIRMIPRQDAEARYRNALTEILTLRSRHAKDCHIIAREALKGANK